MTTRTDCHHTRKIRDAIRYNRIIYGMSQRELARLLGFSSTNFISMIETGAAPLPICRAPAIADFIGVKPWEIIRAVLLENAGQADALLEAHLPAAA